MLAAPPPGMSEHSKRVCHPSCRCNLITSRVSGTHPEHCFSVSFHSEHIPDSPVILKKKKKKKKLYTGRSAASRAKPVRAVNYIPSPNTRVRMPHNRLGGFDNETSPSIIDIYFLEKRKGRKRTEKKNEKIGIRIPLTGLDLILIPWVLYNAFSTTPYQTSKDISTEN